MRPPLNPRATSRSRPGDSSTGMRSWFQQRRCLVPASSYCEPKGEKPATWHMAIADDADTAAVGSDAGVLSRGTRAPVGRIALTLSLQSRSNSLRNQACTREIDSTVSSAVFSLASFSNRSAWQGLAGGHQQARFIPRN
jgi:hypothetical protein